MNSTLRLSVVIGVVLRLFAIFWAISAVTSTLFALSYVWDRHDWMFTATRLAEPVGLLLLALLTWTFADKISHVVLGREDVEMQAPSLEAAHFYTLGFVVVGLYFTLSYLYELLHFVESVRPRRGLTAKEGDDVMFYGALARLAPFLAGLICLFLAPKWGRRVAGAYDKIKAPHP